MKQVIGLGILDVSVAVIIPVIISNPTIDLRVAHNNRKHSFIPWMTFAFRYAISCRPLDSVASITHGLIRIELISKSKLGVVSFD